MQKSPFLCWSHSVIPLQCCVCVLFVFPHVFVSIELFGHFASYSHTAIFDWRWPHAMFYMRLPFPPLILNTFHISAYPIRTPGLLIPMHLHLLPMCVAPQANKSNLTNVVAQHSVYVHTHVDSHWRYACHLAAGATTMVLPRFGMVKLSAAECMQE